MKRSRYTDEQIAYALRQAESGTAVADVCRQLGISEATFYVWKKKYGSLGATELRELRQLREENGKLKRLVADLTLDKHILSEIVRKKSEAGATTRARVMDAGVVWREPESCVPAGADFALAVRLLQPTSRSGRTAPPDARVGSVATAVWVSAHPRLAASRGLDDQHEARATAVPSRRAAAAPSTAADLTPEFSPGWE
jgi:putative transposase